MIDLMSPASKITRSLLDTNPRSFSNLTLIKFIVIHGAVVISNGGPAHIIWCRVRDDAYGQLG